MADFYRGTLVVALNYCDRKENPLRASETLGSTLNVTVVVAGLLVFEKLMDSSLD